MLDNYLLDLPGICLVRSDRLLDRILKELSGIDGPAVKDSLRKEAMGTLLDYHSRRFRLNDYDRAFNPVYVKRDSCWGYSLDYLGEMFDRYLQYTGDRIEVRPGYLGRYSAICCKIHPLIIAAYRLAADLRNDRLVAGDVEQFIINSDPILLPKPESLEIHADNHVHLGGVTETAEALLTWASTPFSALPEAEEEIRLPRIYEFSYINNHLYTPHKLLFIYQELFGTINHWTRYRTKLPAERLRQIMLMGVPFSPGRESNFGRFQKLERMEHSSGTARQLLLLSSQSFSENSLGDAIFYYFTMLIYLYEDKDCPAEIHQAVLAFLHLTNILRSYMVMGGLGLSEFVKYFQSSFRRVPGKRTDDYSLKCLFNPRESLVEIKAGFNIAREDKLLGGMRAVYKRHYTVEETKEDVFIEKLRWSLSRYHYCVHFSRSGKGKEPMPEMNAPIPLRYRHKRKDAKKNAKRLENFLVSAQAKRIPVRELFKSLHSIDSSDGWSLDLCRLIRGIDVAGDENDTPVEVFAPAIRQLRFMPKSFRKSHDRDLHRHSHPPLMHLSIHAGEDFDHLLTGMRRIDETVSFCNFQAGDRIGHGLALGSSPQHWARRQAEIFISRQDHLDNLVWAWHHAVGVASRLPAAQGIALQYEQRIRTQAEIIYGIPYAPGTLFAAWQLRRNDPDRLIDYLRNKNEYNDLLAWVPDYRTYTTLKPNDLEEKSKIDTGPWKIADTRGDGIPALKIYFDYLKDRSVRKTGDQTVKLRIDKYWVNDPHIESITDEELDFFEALQDYLMTLYDEQGLVIEANPSSNTYIGLYENYEDHPLLRWHPPSPDELKPGKTCNRFGLRKGPVKVCINTDDPAIFPTNLHTEYRLMKEAALRKFDISQLEADQWIDRIRRTGVKTFKDNHSEVLFKRVCPSQGLSKINS